MAINITPTAYLPGIKHVTSEADGSLAAATLANSKEYMCINLDDVPKLVSTEITGGSANISKILFALMDAIHEAREALDSADRPTRWLEFFSSSVTGSNLTRTFSHQFTTEFSGEEVIAE